ncbi:MAG: hypothetical protein FWD26_10720 [Treponema sp.]|nr:hypothetical protein [Treponema sp.]
MEIRINGQTLDVNLDNEKTVGQVLAGLEQWLSDSGYILSRLSIDGQEITASQVEEIFVKEIETVKILDIQTENLADITASSLVTLLDDIKEYESLDFNNKTKFFDTWKESAQAQFICAEINDLFSLCTGAFSKGGISAENLYSITEERIREVKEPVNEIKNLEALLNEVCEKLVDLPLDIQTGKDLKAAQTMQLFTSVTEKIFRIFYQLNTQGYLTDSEENKIIEQITDFAGILKELLEAYEKNDSILVGDLAEYEASVRIKKLFSAILENIRSEK